MKKIINFTFYFLILIFFNFEASASLENDLIKKFLSTNTLSFNFTQKISENEEMGRCFIKHPLRMRCDYDNLKQKSIISNGTTVAVIKKKYKKIYLYPIKITPLFIILKKEKILNIIRNNKPIKIDSNLIVFDAIEKKDNKLKILFDENSLELVGWKMVDAYSNNVNFIISDLITNKIIEDKFFKIPQENDL